MHSYPNKARLPGDRDQAAPPFRALVRASFLSACMLFGQPAGAQDGAIYISGQGVSLRAAFDRALAENESSGKQAFWVIVSGYDIVRVTKSGVGRNIQEPMQRIHERHGLIYVCQSDMAFYGIKETDLLEGVKAVRGFSKKVAPDRLPLKQTGIVMPTNMAQAERILRTCAERDGSDVRGARWTRQSGASEADIAFQKRSTSIPNRHFIG